MNSVRKVVNNIKFPKSMKLSLNVEGSGLLHNKAVLYFIFAISFGNFMLELISYNYYFIAVYILIGFLTTFFNKNMIIVLSMAAIFANILTYGAVSVEGMEDGDSGDDNHDHSTSVLDDALAVDISNDGEIIDKALDKITGTKPEKPEKRKKHKSHEPDESDSDSESEEDSDKNKRNKKTKESYKDRLQPTSIEESEKLIQNQKLLLKNMKEFKPFLDTIQGIAKNFTGDKPKDKKVE